MLLIALVTSSAFLKSKSFIPRWREWFAIGLLGLDSFFLCKPCKLIFLAKEMEKPQLCYQINKNIFGCAERLRNGV
jgi:hypothetical protein